MLYNVKLDIDIYSLSVFVKRKFCMHTSNPNQKNLFSNFLPKITGIKKIYGSQEGKDLFTLSKSRNESKKVQRTSEKDQRKNDKHQRTFSLSLLLHLV